MIRAINGQRGLTLFELVITLTIIIVFIGTLFVFMYRAAIHAKEVTLKAELNNLRLSLNLYRALKGNSPPDLKTLLETKYKAAGADEITFQEHFISFLGKDAQGDPVDPFGNKFYFDAQKEVIRSKTEGYEDW
jgi:Tfp pilus assembly protein PilE